MYKIDVESQYWPSARGGQISGVSCIPTRLSRNATVKSQTLSMTRLQTEISFFSPPYGQDRQVNERYNPSERNIWGEQLRCISIHDLMHDALSGSALS
jgi:hypothetical protein